MLLCSSIYLFCPDSIAPQLQVDEENLGWAPAKPACQCSVCSCPKHRQCCAASGALCSCCSFPQEGCSTERHSLHGTRCPWQSQGQICKPHASVVCKIELCIWNVLLKTCLSYRSLNISKYIPTEQSLCLNPSSHGRSLWGCSPQIRKPRALLSQVTTSDTRLQT